MEKIKKVITILLLIGGGIIFLDLIISIYNLSNDIYLQKCFLGAENWWSSSIENTPCIYLFGYGVLAIVPLVVAIGYLNKKKIWKRILVFGLLEMLLIGIFITHVYLQFCFSFSSPELSQLEKCSSHKTETYLYVAVQHGYGGGVYVFREIDNSRLHLLDMHEDFEQYECIWGDDAVQVILREGNEEKVVSYSYEQLQAKQR